MTMKSILLPVPNFNSKVELVYRNLSSSASGTQAVLCLPFWGGSAGTYRAVLQQLNGLETGGKLGTVAALSYPGTGNAPLPATDTAEFHAPRPRAQQLASLLQSREFLEIIAPAKSLIIVAHSASAKVTYELCDILSDGSTPSFTVSSLILLGPAPPGPFELPPGIRDQAKTAYDTMENATWALENNLIASLPADKKNELLKALAEDCFGMSPGAKRGWPELGMKHDCRPAAIRLHKAWPHLKISVMVGSEDVPEPVEKVKKETAEVLKDIGFDVQEAVIQGCGHLIPMERPDTIVEEIQKLLE